MTETPRPAAEPKTPTALERVLQAYTDVSREFQLIEEAERTHRDRMLTWSIGLMGGGVFATIHLASEGVCSSLGVAAFVWAASPWMLGVLLAVLGRISGACYREVFNILSAGETYLVRLELARGLSEESAQDLFRRLSNDLSRTGYERKATWAKAITSTFHYLSLAALLVGMATVFWRVVTC